MEAFRKHCQEKAESQKQQALELERVKFRPKFEALDSDLPDEPPPAPTAKASWLGGLFGGDEPARKASPDLTPKQVEKVRKLTADYQAKKNELLEKWKRAGEACVEIQVKPRKTDVRITHFGIGWVPCLRR